MSFMITVSISIIVYVCTPQLILAFTKDIYIQNTAVKYLRLISIIYPLVATSLPCGRILQGFGLGMPLLIITSICVLLVSSPLAAFLFFLRKTSGMDLVFHDDLNGCLIRSNVNLGLPGGQEVFINKNLNVNIKRLSINPIKNAIRIPFPNMF